MQGDKVTPISCLCGDVAQEVELKQSANHSALNFCHCTACRTVTGMLCSTYYPLQAGPESLDSLQVYQEADCISRYFCKTCGAHVFAHAKNTGQFFVAAGLLVGRLPPTNSIRHWRAAETRDGGLTPFLSGQPEESAPACWLRTVPSNQASHTEVGLELSSRDSDELLARCHCGGVEFYITRPDSSSTKPTSPWSDLLAPYHSSSSSNPQDVKWWLQDENTKYLAGTCACPSCRLASGFPIQPWAFVPLSNLYNTRKAPLAFGTGTMRQYKSSPGVYREFCSRCGASIFWHDDERPLLIDVSVGLLRAEEGSRASGWLKWATQRVSFAEMAADQALIQQLQNGLKIFGDGN
ncbi:hypothetical protein AnigIFM63604_000408 [Aspergillus niger]|uniref:CENP-V/GFA domain-containing protein n=2 Tax=Aspergillus TaxID=5052 RepID=A0A370PE36_ASPPH|nr:hypothetical protein CBS147346_8151 [Aspergillus niger]RDK40447.1 hypothetical protein M752DRAFT_328471 [Aspergillus phoenicis ATCC 13157]GLA46926.1 hypothetical protein AnigIFM63604_000408 [Aspergillus niger]